MRCGMVNNYLIWALVCFFPVSASGTDYIVSTTPGGGEKIVESGKEDIALDIEPGSLTSSDKLTYKAGLYMGNLKGNGPPETIKADVIVEDGVTWVAGNAWLDEALWENVSDTVYRCAYDRDDINRIELRLITDPKDLDKIIPLKKTVTPEKPVLNEWGYSSGYIYINIGRAPAGKEVRPWATD